MTAWIKVYNSMPSHPKIVKAGDRAAWLFVCGCCYSNEHLTDGFIASHVLPVAAPGVRHAEQLAGRLVQAGLWHEVDGGWRIHDYDEHQRSAAQIRVQRAKDAKRKADARGASNGSPPRSPRGQNADSTSDSARIPQGVRDVEVEVEQKRTEKALNSNASLHSAVVECFAYWQERCDHPQAALSPDRRGKIETRLRERAKLGDGIPRAVRDIRRAIDGAAVAPFVDSKGKRFDDIELICRTGSKLEDFMGRAGQRSSAVRDDSHLPPSWRVTPEHQAQIEAFLARNREEPA